MDDLALYEQFKELWEEDSLFVIDSCSILDLYRYAPRVSKSILENLRGVQKNIWIPNQVLEEYLQNKGGVIKKAHKKYENVSLDVERAIEKANNTINAKFQRYGKFKYPEIYKFKGELDEIISSLHKKANSFKNILSTEIKENRDVLIEDDVNTFIHNLIESNQVGNPFSLSQKMKIYREGEFRYNYLIPPGYKDTDKDDKDETKTEKFGDLFVWKEILKKSSENERPFIFITDDEKEDWWKLKKQSGYTGTKVELQGPRPELVSEFDEISMIGKEGFLMLTLPQFNKYLSKINEVNAKEVYLNDIEIDPEHVVWNIVHSKEWGLLLDESSELTNYLIHDGELQELTGEILSDVEVVEFGNPEFDDLYVDYEENEVIIEGGFISEVLVRIETALSREYHECNDAKLLLNGSITVEFNVEYDEDKDAIERVNEGLSISGIEINEYETIYEVDDYLDVSCIVCELRPGVYRTYENEPVCKKCMENFDVCTGCGKLFEIGTISSKCLSCED